MRSESYDSFLAYCFTPLRQNKTCDSAGWNCETDMVFVVTVNIAFADFLHLRLLIPSALSR